MSTFENEHYKWRETYFVLFDVGKRPTLDRVATALRKVNPRFELSNMTEDDEGRFESLTIHSPQDYAALDISFVSGEEVTEQGAELAKELKSIATEPEERAKLARLPKFDARLDVLHFEEVVRADVDEDLEEMLDPSALLTVLDALVRVTGGVGVDPQSGTVV